MMSGSTFFLGDKYDLLLNYGKVATVTLTALVGTGGDEEVGNDSFIGALATLQSEDDLRYLTNGPGVYVMRRHRKLSDGKPKSPTRTDVAAGLQNEPVRFEIQTKIVALLNQSIGMASTHSPVVAVQAFHLANGKLRYYARAAWNSGEGDGAKTKSALGAWISPSPTLHIVAGEGRTSP
jgi:hypothetical protein